MLIKRNLLLGTALLAAAAMCVAHPGHPPLPTPTYSYARASQTLPFELFRGNRIFIPAVINGHQTRVMLDTGASLTTVDRAYAESIGLPHGFKIQAKGVGGDTDAELVTGLTLEVAGLRVGNSNVGVMDLTPIERSIGRPINVILGRDIFNQSVVSIDWASKRLTLTSPAAFGPAANATAVGLTKKGPFNSVPVSIAGAPPIEALLDLGNGGALTLQRAYWVDRPELRSLKTAEFEEGGVGGARSARLVTVPQITIGGESFTAIPSVLTESGPQNDLTQMAAVGIGLLKQFRIDLDLGHDRIYLAPATNRPGFDRDRAGARFDLEGSHLKASFVSPDGPAAAAGLKQGDEIVAVDGRPVTPAYYEAPDWTRGAAGRKIVLKRADGSKVEIKLADYY
jgi:aspartyl protease/PDZ domain-containing protein